MTSGLSVEYEIINNTHSYDKGAFGQFWDNVKKLFGVELQKDTGLNLKDPNIHNGLSGSMVAYGDHFEVNGIPLTPVNDSGTWNPFQIGEIMVKDSAGNVVAQTSTTVPTSDEINCTKCHGADAFNDILQKHDKNNGTDLVNQKPVLCASCHGTPALGNTEAGPFNYLSERIHGFHSTVSPTPACYDCHPGTYTNCSRSLAHTVTDGNCTTCHGDLTEVSMSIDQGRVPWLDEPKCASCHSGVAEVDTQTTLYRNATGHGGVYCAACHYSPHAMVPTNLLSDNYQALQYQGEALPIGACEVCHGSSKGGGDGGGEGSSEFKQTHGGSNPEIASACSVCHTSVPADTSKWPHAFQWKARK